MNIKYYTSEENVRIVIALLKAYGIKRVIASPGTTNMTFVGSIQNDDFFEIYSSVDERSAAYLACGMAAETGEPVVISCTGATASRNYLSGLTEAYYRKLPVLAITSHRGDHAIGHLIDQQIDRRSRPNDVSLCSVSIPIIKDDTDRAFCHIETCRAIVSLYKFGGGPSHINLHTTYSQDFSFKELPSVNKIERFTAFDELPLLPEKSKIAIFVGSHKKFSDIEIEAIDKFCEAHDGIVFYDHTSGYNGHHGVNANILFQQIHNRPANLDVDILIHIGEVSGSVPRMAIKSVWRVSPDGELRNTFNKLAKVFEMKEEYFFKSFTPETFQPQYSFLNLIKEECSFANKMIAELPFSNVWIAQQIHSRIPTNSILYLGINNSLRSFNFFELPNNTDSDCNVGGYGIDGGISTLIGGSLINPERLHIGVFGDLAFFYDMNVLGNRHVGNNVRILMINNGKGNEFRNYGHICSIWGEEGDKYIAAGGHFGNKSSQLVRHYAEDLGYQYLSASTKDEFLNKVTIFLNPNISERAIIFEVFTETEGESDAIKIMRNLYTNSSAAFMGSVMETIKGAIGIKGKRLIKKIIRK